MKHLVNCVKSFAVSEEGPTATEYAVMLALIVMVCIVSISSIGTNVAGLFTTLDSGLPTGTAS